MVATTDDGSIEDERIGSLLVSMRKFKREIKL